MFFNKRSKTNAYVWDKKILVGQLQKCLDPKIILDLAEMRTGDSWTGIFKDMPYPWLNKQIIKINRVKEGILSIIVGD